jgi:TRL (tRNA-associated locus)-like protein
MTRFMTLILIMGIAMTGCMIVDSPVKGMFGNNVRWGDFAQGDDRTPDTKEGRACLDTILGLFARGDASVRAAKADGKITEVSVIDHSARNFLNIVGEYCTIVRGK